MYKTITNLQKLCGRLVGAAKTHAQLISESVALRIRGRFRGRYPDVLELQIFIAEDLEVIRELVVVAETSLMASLTADQRGRAVRNRWFAKLREQLLAIRKILDGLYGPGTSDIVFMKVNSFVHVDPVAIHRQANLVRDNLLDAGLALPDPRFDIGADLQRLAREMEPNIEGLGQVLEELRLQGTEQSLAEKEALLADANEKAGLSARLLEALAAWAGHPGIARRIRQSSHAASAQAPEGGAPQAEPAAPGQAGTGQPQPAEDGPAERATPVDAGAASPADSPGTGTAASDSPPAEAAPSEVSTAASSTASEG